MNRQTIPRLARTAFWLAALGAYVLAILPGGEPTLLPSNDKVDHILAFFTLSVLARLGWSTGRAWVIAVLLIAFGAFIELSQAMPLIHRDAELGDLLADAGATLVGLIVGTLVARRARRERT